MTNVTSHADSCQQDGSKRGYTAPTLTPVAPTTTPFVWDVYPHKVHLAKVGTRACTCGAINCQHLKIIEAIISALIQKLIHEPPVLGFIAGGKRYAIVLRAEIYERRIAQAKWIAAECPELETVATGTINAYYQLLNLGKAVQA